MNPPKISIVIPTINRYNDLRNTINDLQAQEYQDFEIIVVDQTDDAMFEEIGEAKNLIQIREWIKSASRARNIGLRNAKGKYVLFLDDDVIIKDTSYIRNIVDNFNSETVVGVVGPIIEESNPVIRMDRHPWSKNRNWGWLIFPRNYGKTCKINDGGAGNLCVIKEYALAIGGMDEQFRKGAHREESDFNQRYTKTYGWYQYDPSCALIHIGRRDGGVRTWDTVRSKSVKAQHHYDGSWYFLLKNINVIHWPAHILSMKMFFFFRKELFMRPDWMIISIWRFFKGFFNGLRMIAEGPVYLSR